MKPKDLIQRLKQNNMLRDDIDEEILGFLIQQFENSVIGNLDTSEMTRPFMDEIRELRGRAYEAPNPKLGWSNS